MTWEADVEAATPEEAAGLARYLQRCAGGGEAFDVFNLATGEEVGVFVKEPMRPEAVT